LTQLPSRAGRSLNLTMIGGLTVLPALAPAFNRVTYIDTSAFMAAMHRQRLYLNNEGKMKKLSELTLIGQPVDSLLVENIATMRARIESLLP
jgi:hypothetical protein